MTEAIAQARDQVAILTNAQRRALHSALADKPLALCFGAGVDSTAMIVALREAGIRPDVLTFADVNSEKALTYQHLAKMNRVLSSWGWPTIDVCKKVTKDSTPYNDLYGNCMSNETLPSLAFGLKSCSLKYKTGPQDAFLKGAKTGPGARPPHPIWIESQRTGKKITKLIGYDSGRADMKRSKSLKKTVGVFDYVYPLQLLGWERSDCVQAIRRALGDDMVPVKSACFFCPASKIWELYWLAAYEPEKLEAALVLERNALTGRHSRFDEVEFGASWEDMVRNADSFPSSNTTVGLGRSFAWNQWARVNDVVDADFKVRRTHRHRFIAISNALRGDDNALDSRTPCSEPEGCAEVAA